MAGRLVAVLAVALVMVGVSAWALLSGKNSPAIAQQGGGDCPGAQTVNTTTGSGDKQSSVFNITGTSFRLTANTTATSQDPQDADFTALVYPEGETQQYVGDFDVQNGGSDSSIIHAGPGSFYLKLNTANVNYTIIVEDCAGTSGGSTQGTGGGATQGKAGISPPSPPSQPKSSSPPPNPSPPPSPSGTLMNAGGPTDGPVPTMPQGGCPDEFPVQQGRACYTTS